MNEIPRCPFCGHVPYLDHGPNDITYIICDGCGAIVSFRPKLKGSAALEAYAKRATEIPRIAHEAARP
jgi:transcription elongation factor Elf1